MKKIILFLLIFTLAVSCSKNDPPNRNYNQYDLYLRDDAAKTLIPLLDTSSWKFRRNSGTDEKPDKQIKALLLNDRVIDIRMLPVRQFDDNQGWGKYEGQVLCYITEHNTVYFYMGDKILVGRYLQQDLHGNESVIWDFELPTYSGENDARQFTLNRGVPPHLVVYEEDLLQEVAGYETVEVELSQPVINRYTECKLFQYNSKKTNPAEATRINKFYFKEGMGLIRYQQYVQADGQEPILLYEQDLIE